MAIRVLAQVLPNALGTDREYVPNQSAAILTAASKLYGTTDLTSLQRVIERVLVRFPESHAPPRRRAGPNDSSVPHHGL